jgi:hypothetical protein
VRLKPRPRAEPRTTVDSKVEPRTRRQIHGSKQIREVLEKTGSHRVGVLVSVVGKRLSFRFTVLLLYPAIFLLILESFQKALSNSEPKIAIANSPIHCQGPPAEDDGMCQIRRCGHASRKERESYGSSERQMQWKAIVARGAYADRQRIMYGQSGGVESKEL